jgi:DNA replication protein DnaC
MLRLASVDVLIIDDLGLQPLSSEDAHDLYEIIHRRYEHGSMIVTSNREVEEWYPLFCDELLASAALDRLLHHAHTVTLDGDSYRNPGPGRGGDGRDPRAA